jgi:tRNA-specific 2-thiouridylase
VVQGHDHAWLLSPWLEATDLSWVAGEAPPPGELAAKTRYRQADATCRYSATDQGLRLDFAQAQWAVTPGQSAVLYQGEVCLGGGVISSARTPAVVAPMPAAPRRRQRQGSRP